MTVDSIIANIHSRLGIAELNAMQLAVKASRASRLTLLAPTGSGKTVAFAIAMLRSMSKSKGMVQALVLAPSRELVLQIYDVVRKLASDYKTVAFYGGHSMREEQNSLSQIPDIIIATPGRMLDHLQRSTVYMSSLKTLVVDEFDKSLELGFRDEMSRIVKRIGRLSTIVLTSATELKDTASFIDMSGGEIIDCRESVNRTEPAKLHIARVESPVRDKADILIGLLKSLPNGRALVFVNHRESAERVYEILKREGLPAGLYHGGLEQRDREMAVRMLDNGSKPILVTTDLASRGLDIAGLDTVIHYHMPPTAEAWTHRNGRTARAGASGEVFVIISEADNIPEYVVWNNDYVPTGTNHNPIRANYASVYINAGKKEKISKGDVVGFLCQKGDLAAGEIGRIDVSDHHTVVAVAASKATDLLRRIASEKLKGQRVKCSLVE